MRCDHPVDAHLRSLEEQLLRGDVRRCPERITALLADDFTEITSSGQVLGVTEVLAGLLREGAVHWTLSGFTARTVAPDVVLVIYRALRQEPETPRQYSQRSSVWRRTERRWRMVFHQGTPLPADDPP